MQAAMARGLQSFRRQTQKPLHWTRRRQHHRCFTSSVLNLVRASDRQRSVIPEQGFKPATGQFWNAQYQTLPPSIQMQENAPLHQETNGYTSESNQSLSQAPFGDEHSYKALLAYYEVPSGSILPLAVISEAHRATTKRISNIVEKQTITVNSSAFKDAQHDAARRRILRQHLDASITSRDIFRVVAVALQRPRVADELPHLSQRIIRAFFRSRRTSSDLTIASKMMVLVNRFDKAGLRVDSLLLTEGLKFAIRSRNQRIVKRFLREIRLRDGKLSRKVFRSAIAKCSIGLSRMGEIRNGPWNREELLQVVLGFPDAQPDEEYHLGSFLDRSDWHFMSGWLLILSWCAAKEQLLKEWRWWRSSSQPRADEDKDGPRPTLFGRPPADVDRLFVSLFVKAGDLARAWQILKETEIEPLSLDQDLLHKLLERADLATFWNKQLSKALAEKFNRDLQKVEHILGVYWAERNGIKCLVRANVPWLSFNIR